MKVDIRTPAAGESVSEAVVAAVFKENGAVVAKEEEILELETDKVNQVVYAPEAGELHLNVKVDAVVKPEQVIGTIETEVKHGKTAPPPAPQPSPATPQPVEKGGVRHSVDAFVSSVKNQPDRPPAAAPAAHKAPPPKQPPPSLSPPAGEKQRRVRLSGLRRTVAKRLVAAKNETAMLTTFNEVDMSEIMAIRAREKENFLKKNGVKLGFMSFFVKACVAALKEIPALNAFLDQDAIVYQESYHIGISVSTEKGLMVPVLKGCDGVETTLQEMAHKAREGSIAVSDLQGGTFTITNGGVFGSMLSTPILNPPQSAILGMHNIVSRPVVVDGQVAIRPIMYLALSYDHRIVDGKESIVFLTTVKALLEKPERLLLDF